MSFLCTEGPHCCVKKIHIRCHDLCSAGRDLGLVDEVDRNHGPCEILAIAGPLSRHCVFSRKLCLSTLNYLSLSMSGLAAELSSDEMHVGRGS